ncbi:MAG: anthranilate phosphoribosyltransferase [Candidatus Nanohaloarchaea archaeon]
MTSTTIEKAVNGKNLTRKEASETLEYVFEGASDAEIGALLAGLSQKGETDAEIAGFARKMREEAEKIDPDRDRLIDTCGTGGDEYDTINVSTTSAIVAAASGASVAKHGNYSVSSKSGSADVLEKLGIEIGAEPGRVETVIEEVGIGFQLAPVFHPAMERVIGPRKDLGIETVFNILGPLTNPADVDGQVVGVYSPELVDRIAGAISMMDVEKALVVHGSGLDEIAVHGETEVAEVTGEDVERYSIAPGDLGLDTSPVSEIEGGPPEENAEHLRRILSGEETGAKRDIVLANTGAALYVSGRADSIQEGIEIARRSIREGKTVEKLDQMREYQ